MCKSSAGPGRNNTIWKLSVSALCQPATRYTPHPPLLLKNIPSGAPMAASFSDSPPLTPSGQETVVQPRSQRAQGPRFLSFFSPLPTLRWLCWLLAQAWERRVERHGERAAKTERDGEKVLKFAFLIWSPRHFTLLQDLKSPLIPPHLPLDFFLKWQGFPQNSCSPDGRTEATSHAADSHVSWQLTLSQSCDQFDLFVCFN